MTVREKFVLAVAAPIILIAVDRLAKWYALVALSSGTSVVLFPGLNYGFFSNAGLIFSSFGPAIATIASAVAFAALALLGLRQCARLKDRATPSALWPFLLIALGGGSNIYDRISYGGVIDYILFARSAWNIADIMILAGVVLVLAHHPKGGKTETRA
jgi:lipoprotein signal peptidase